MSELPGNLTSQGPVWCQAASVVESTNTVVHALLPPTLLLSLSSIIIAENVMTLYDGLRFWIMAHLAWAGLGLSDDGRGRAAVGFTHFNPYIACSLRNED